MSDTIEFYASCVRETTDAILVCIDGEDYWIPKSHIDDSSEVYGEGDEGDLVVSEWIAKEKGLV